MKGLSRLGIVVGSLILAALFLTVCAPRAVHAFAAALVQVTNTVSTPVPTEEALGTATLVDLVCANSSQNGTSGEFGFGCSSFDGTSFIVPSGQRAVLEYVDGNCLTPSSAAIGFALMSLSRGLEAESHYLPVQPALSVSAYSSFTFATPTRLYLDAGDNVSFAFFTSDTTGGTSCTAYVSGRLVPTK